MSNPKWKGFSLCGGKAKSTGLPCRHVALSQNGRCYYHNGRKPTKHGRYTKTAKAQRSAQRRLITGLREQANSIKDTLGI